MPPVYIARNTHLAQLHAYLSDFLRRADIAEAIRDHRPERIEGEREHSDQLTPLLDALDPDHPLNFHGFYIVFMDPRVSDSTLDRFLRQVKNDLRPLGGEVAGRHPRISLLDTETKRVRRSRDAKVTNSKDRRASPEHNSATKRWRDYRTLAHMDIEIQCKAINVPVKSRDLSSLLGLKNDHVRKTAQKMVDKMKSFHSDLFYELKVLASDELDRQQATENKDLRWALTDIEAWNCPDHGDGLEKI
jgi:cob(I)alamin adenosyltransferase